MRDKLAPHLGKRLAFNATFADQYRQRGGGKFPAVKMMLLVDVKFHGEICTDHLWMNCGQRFDPTAFKRGDIVAFKATVVEYEKGYLGRRNDGLEGITETDLKLARPSNVRLATVPEKGQATLESTLTTWRERGF
ncbi:MAG: hypothetical protein KGI71_04535 [Patescibacteria group bacterium]|nr:hypothetical protein [Patescibacteria group bacterium]